MALASLFVSCGAGYQTQGLVHTNQELYNSTTSPAFGILSQDLAYVALIDLELAVYTRLPSVFALSASAS